MDLKVRPFNSSAGGAMLELRGVVRSANRARSISSLVSLHFRMVFLTVFYLAFHKSMSTWIVRG